ncbi:hypothetical protein JOF54_000277 [Microlunatus capsulatus]|uniref:Uncharacterized protein n=1 Tax=Microlunatus capsulatus TaxID=99117 RepID=A0ABS4Z3N9_9ACTN|nr:hypothetical protein [Microlunatus capsulatus]
MRRRSSLLATGPTASTGPTDPTTADGGVPALAVEG